MTKYEKIITLILALLLSFSLLGGCGRTAEEAEEEPFENGEQIVVEEQSYDAGTYSSTIRGHQGDIKVTVTFSENEIIDIIIDEHKESVGIGNHAIDLIPGRIIDMQSIAVDTISGATITSASIIQAVVECAEEAGGNIGILRQRDVDSEIVTSDLIALETDVLVIGGGGAGLSAAIEASRGGTDVIILEKLDYLGGDTGRAGGGIEAAGTTFQEANGINDTPEDFAAFIRSRGVEFKNPELLDTMVNESAKAVYFLADLGADMSMQVAGHGSPVARAHRPAQGSAGQNIIVPMVKEIERLGLEVYLGTPAYELIFEEGAVVGALARHTKSGQEFEIRSSAVVIATGNFASNNEMVSKYDNRLKGVGTNSSAGSQGDGIIMATAVGADLENMEIMRVRPTLPTNAINYIAVSQDGMRFMDEYHSEDTIFVEGTNLHIKAVEDHEEKHYWIIMDGVDFDAQSELLSSYLLPNNYYKADSLEELAELTELDYMVLTTTITEWNEMLQNGVDTKFGRTRGMEKPIEGAPYYAIKVLPTVHNTAGGIRINTKCEVIDADENIIPGLYAAGEVTGGVHDGVSAVCCALVHGRISGINASEYSLLD